MHKYAKAVVISLLLCAGLLVQTGCLSEPRTIVNSLDQIKQDLSDQPDVCYPDLSDYDQSQIEFKTNLYQGDRSIKNGYTIHIIDDDIHTLQKTSGKSSLNSLTIRCDNEELYYDKYNPIKPLQSNATYRGLPIEHAIWEETEIIDTNRGTDESSLFPIGTRGFCFNYTFSINGYRYSADAAFILLPEQLEYINVEDEKDKADAEVRSIVDGMLDQGGVPR